MQITDHTDSPLSTSVGKGPHDEQVPKNDPRPPETSDRPGNRVAILGAGGNMGRRVTRGLMADAPGKYELRLIEAAPAGVDRLAAEGNRALVTEEGEGLHDSDVVVFAIPDRVVRDVAPKVIEQLPRGSSILFLDPAAVAADRVPVRDDISCFVTHPTHPPLYSLLDEQDPAARKDYWGGGLARQALVFAHAWGDESPASEVETLCRHMFSPVTACHRITVQQMALLEPALTEMLAIGCLSVIKQGLEETVSRGVPEAAATDFLMGHLQIGIALIFDQLDWQLSEGAQVALRMAREQLFRDDWKTIFDEANLQTVLRQITGGD